MYGIGKTALVLGATGVTGTAVVMQLLQDYRYERIVVLSRTPLPFTHYKIEEHIVDLLQLKHHEELFVADDVFCCVGTTAAKTPNREHYKAVDYGIPVAAAKLALAKEIRNFVVVSSLGANASSSVFYSKLKGEMEEAVLALGLRNTYVMQPSLISGNRKESRPGERFAKLVMNKGSFLFLGPLKKYKPVAPEAIAKAMIWAVNTPDVATRIPSDKIQEIAQYIK